MVTVSWSKHWSIHSKYFGCYAYHHLAWARGTENFLLRLKGGNKELQTLRIWSEIVMGFLPFDWDVERRSPNGCALNWNSNQTFEWLLMFQLQAWSLEVAWYDYRVPWLQKTNTLFFVSDSWFAGHEAPWSDMEIHQVVVPKWWYDVVCNIRYLKAIESLVLMDKVDEIQKQGDHSWRRVCPSILSIDPDSASRKQFAWSVLFRISLRHHTIYSFSWIGFGFRGGFRGFEKYKTVKLRIRKNKMAHIAHWSTVLILCFVGIRELPSIFFNGKRFISYP